MVMLLSNQKPLRAPASRACRLRTAGPNVSSRRSVSMIGCEHSRMPAPMPTEEETAQADGSQASSRALRTRVTLSSWRRTSSLHCSCSATATATSHSHSAARRSSLRRKTRGSRNRSTHPRTRASFCSMTQLLPGSSMPSPTSARSTRTTPNTATALIACTLRSPMRSPEMQCSCTMCRLT